MLTYEQNVKAVLECIFAGYKDELIEDAGRRICALSRSEIPNTCDDAISRQAVLNAMYDLCDTGETLKENPWRDNPHIDAIIDAIDDLPSVTPQQKVGRWIPISERLPENDTIVLVTFANGMVSMSSWHENTQYNNGFDNIGHGITEDGTVLNYGTVTWMPLPEPYKGEGRRRNE